MPAVADLQIWADHQEVIRLPHIESEIAVLQIDQADTSALLTQKAQEFHDRLNAHTIQIAAAQDDADTAGSDAFTALTRIGQVGIDATTYTDARIQELRDELSLDWDGRITDLQNNLDNSIGLQVTAALPDLQTEIASSLAQITSIRDEMFTLMNGTNAAIDDLTVNVIPDIDARLTSADGTAVAARDSFTVLATDYEHVSLVAGFDAIEAQVGSLSATITNEYYTKVDADSAIAAKASELRTEIDGDFVTITDFSTSVDGIKGTYGLEINNNGYISGFGLISDLVDGVNVSDFIINASTFRVASGATNYTPFAVYTAPRTVDGATVPAGVYASDLYVTRANITDLAVDTLKIGDNAVTVPVVSYGFGEKTGNNAWQGLALIVVDMPIAGQDCALMWNIAQGYVNLPSIPPWGFRIIQGASTVLFSRENMGLGNDYPSGTVLATGLSAGFNTFELQWKGANSDIVANGMLVGVGVAR